jgi:hypothetical protein
MRSVARMIKSRRGKICSMNGGKRNGCRLLVVNPDGMRQLGGWMIFRRILQIVRGGIEWTDLPQDRDQWRALVNVAINLLFSSGKFLAVSREGLSPMELLECKFLSALNI